METANLKSEDQNQGDVIVRTTAKKSTFDAIPQKIVSSSTAV